MVFDRSKFIGQFKAETHEHLQNLTNGLLKLEKIPSDQKLLEAMMREAHTIKGSATMMGYNRIADIAHGMEDGLEKALKGKAALKKKHFDILLKCVDAIAPLLEDKITWEDKGVAKPYPDSLCEDMAAAFSEKDDAAEKAVDKQKTEQATPPIFKLSEESMRVDINKLDNLMNLAGELTVSKVRLNELIRNLTNKVESCVSDAGVNTLIKELNKADDNISLVASNIQDEVMKVRMVPVSYLFNLFPRAMRELSNESGKDVDISIEGEDTHIDKAIIDEMKDPIMHILRNSIDHGIESSDERVNKNKPREGKIGLKAYQVGGQVVIEVSDDGRGIDPAKVKEIIAANKLIDKDKLDNMTDDQICQLIFLPGFTTKGYATEISGRGVGLDVVRDRVIKLKGSVEVASCRDIGTKVMMKLPLTLAITECLLVGSGSDRFAMPIDSVVETIRIELGQIKSVETREAITVRGQIMPLVRLSDIFNLPAKGIVERKYSSVVVVQVLEKRAALMVDALLGRLDIVRKALGDPLKNIKYISGATVLGDGKVVLILDIPSIIDSFESGAAVKRPFAPQKKSEQSEKKRRKTILLAEDAMTTAMLEKSILESSGFSVVIAKDGQEAIEKAMQEKFDLIITDVLMPRMDGFELTAALRKEKVYKDAPIIIVTTRESDADKRRGLEAGADAYILKSEFTSEGLLDTIERLIG
ncbi:MAG: hybrid sensor histidine kinase/response regulator [Candidatus Omnitrophota bacterium]